MHNFLDVMEKGGSISPEQHEVIEAAARQTQQTPIRVMLSLNIVDPFLIQECLANFFNVLPMPMEVFTSPLQEWSAFVPREVAIMYRCFGFGLDEQSRLMIATDDPSLFGLKSQLEFFLDKIVILHSASPANINAVLSFIYNLSPDEKRHANIVELSLESEVVEGIENDQKSSTPHDEVELNRVIMTQTEDKYNELQERLGVAEIASDPKKVSIAFSKQMSDLIPNIKSQIQSIMNDNNLTTGEEFLFQLIALVREQGIGLQFIGDDTLVFYSRQNKRLFVRYKPEENFPNEFKAFVEFCKPLLDKILKK